MKAILIVVALGLIATCSGEEDAKNAETQDKKAVADTEKEFAAIKAELKRLRDETGKKISDQKKEIEEQLAKQKEENEELRRQLAKQKMDGEIRVTEEIAKERVHNDQLKTEIDEENFKLVELVKQRAVKQQSKRQNDEDLSSASLLRRCSEIIKYVSTAEMTRLKTVNAKVGCDSCGGNPPDRWDDQWVTGHRRETGSAYDAPFPHLLWFEFGEFHIPAKFSFTRGTPDNRENTNTKKTPKTWQFVGSPDENCDHSSNWVELCGDLSGGNYVANAVRSCEVPKYARTAFKCLGIKILSNNNDKDDLRRNEVWLQKIRFWEVL